MASHPEFKFETTAAEVATAFPEPVRGKTILITGVAPNGIGKTAAAALAEQSPACLILSGRSAANVEAVIDDLKPRFPDIKYIFLEMDLSSIQSVRNAAASLNQNPDVHSIDILINNAGVMSIPTRTLSPDGLELHFATNHIGHFLFTNLILPKLISAASANGPHSPQTRIVNLTSSGHQFSPVRFSDPTFLLPNASVPVSEQVNFPALTSMLGVDLSNDATASTAPTYIPMGAYGQSKTANILFSISLHQKLYSKYNIASFAVHPGTIHTDLARHLDPAATAAILEQVGKPDAAIRLKTREQGASTTLVAALDPKLKVDVATRASGGEKQVANGIYLADCQVADAECADWAKDLELAERLWEMSEGIVGEQFVW